MRAPSSSSNAKLAPLLALVIGALAGCSGSERPRDTFRVAVAPLELPGLGRVCYDLRVTNAADGAGEVVWSRGTPGPSTTTPDPTALCSDAYGNGPRGDLTYVGTCDASGELDGDPAAERMNSVTLWVDALYDDTDAPISADGPDGWQDPCPTGCTLDALCEENADTLVAFDLTILRQANQGFFDVAVTFEDIFCSAKVDCVDDAGAPLDLLFHPDTAQRDTTVVAAFACTAGPSATARTILYRDPLVLTCGGAPIALAPARDNGNAYTAASPDPDPNDPVWQYAVYAGDEALECGGLPCAKSYWNVAIGLDPTTACTLTTRMTAAPEGTFNGLATPAGTTYPFIDVNVPLSSAGALTCTQHPLNAPGSGVATDYTDIDTALFFAASWSSAAVNECALGTDNCDPNATCTDTAEGFTCACNTGFSGDGTSCADVDECTANTDTCDTNATCTNTVGSYTCACNTGFSGDGTSCSPIDACIHFPCGTNALCTDLPGAASDDVTGRTCACPDFYEGDPETLCEPVVCPPDPACGAYAPNQSGGGCTLTPAAVGTTCRAAQGVCDLAETCDGTSTACPADLKSTAECRPAAGPCDVADACDGVGDDCPVDAFVTAGTECRAAVDVCDVAESCSGSAAACPTDGFAAAGTTCETNAVCTADGGSMTCQCAPGYTGVAGDGPPTGAVGLWNFDGTAEDALGTHDGTVTGLSYVSAQCGGQAVKGAGTSGVVSIPDDAALDLTTFTFEVWLRVDALAANNSAVIFKGDSAGSDGSSPFGLLVWKSGNVNSGKLAGTVAGTLFFGSTVLPIGQFVHVAMTANGSTLTLYVNGQPDGGGSYAGVPQNSAYPLQLGGIVGNSINTLNGAIDQVVVYDRALSPAEIADRAAVPPCADTGCTPTPAGCSDIVDTGLIYFVDADEPTSYPGTGTVWSDLSRGLDCTLNGATTFNSTDGAMAFNGTSGTHVSCPAAAAPLAGASQMTVSFWVKKAAASADVALGVWEHTGRNGWFIQWFTDNNVYFGISQGGVNNNYASLPWTAGTWHHVTGVFDGTRATFETRNVIYLDGVAQTSVGSTQLTSLPTSSAELRLGGLVNYGSYSNGAIANVAIYNRALSAAEVQQNFNAGRDPCPPASRWDGSGTGVLDGSTGAAAGYSLRALSRNYVGPLTRVRRASDNALIDVYALANGALDTAVLTGFLGANTGTVATWYDQSGNARHATQATTASQPRIALSGVVDLVNGKPALKLDGTDDHLVADGVASVFTGTDKAGTFFSVHALDASQYSELLALGNSGSVNDLFKPFSDDGAGAYYSNRRDSAGTLKQVTYGATSLTQTLMDAYFTGTQLSVYRNGARLVNAADFDVGATTLNTFTLGALRRNTTQGYAKASFQEVLVYPTDRNADRSTLQSALASHYGLTLEGLVVSLDAGNAASYPGTGSTWTDLSGANNHATLVGSPTYQTTAGGNLTFTGSNYGNLGNVSYDRKAFSVFCWGRMNANHTNWAGVMVSKWYTGGGTVNNEFSLGGTGITGPSPLGVAIQTNLGITVVTDTVNYQAGTWYHLGFTWDNGSLKLYKNGVLVASTTTTGTIATTTQPMALATFYDLNTYRTPTSLGTVTMHNRALSAAEIQATWNAQRARFGL